MKRDETDEGMTENNPDQYFEPEEELVISDPASGEEIMAYFSVRPFAKECLEFVN